MGHVISFAPLPCIIMPFALGPLCIIGQVMPVYADAGFISGSGLGAGAMFITATITVTKMCFIDASNARRYGEIIAEAGPDWFDLPQGFRSVCRDIRFDRNDRFWANPLAGL